MLSLLASTSLLSTINNHHLYIRNIIRWKIPDQIFETFASSHVQGWRLPVVVSLQSIEFQLHNINSKSLIYQNLKFQNLAQRVFNFNTAGPISSLKIPCSICPFNCTFYTIGALPEKINFNTISFLSLLPFEYIIWNYFLSSLLSLPLSSFQISKPASYSTSTLLHGSPLRLKNVSKMSVVVVVMSIIERSVYDRSCLFVCVSSFIFTFSISCEGSVWVTKNEQRWWPWWRWSQFLKGDGHLLS